MQGELGRRLKHCCKQKKKKKVAMVARTATIGRGPCAFGLVSLNPVGKVQRKRGKVRKSARKVSRVEEKWQKKKTGKRGKKEVLRSDFNCLGD